MKDRQKSGPGLEAGQSVVILVSKKQGRKLRAISERGAPKQTKQNL